jgi:hypothetical protein
MKKAILSKSKIKKQISRNMLEFNNKRKEEAITTQVMSSKNASEDQFPTPLIAQYAL